MKRILEVQKEIGVLSKKSENPFFKSDYLDLNDLLNAVKPLLEEKGLILMQPLLDGNVSTVIVDAVDGKLLATSSIAIPSTLTDPQKIGSCITYFRRYTLKSLLAIAEEDDDGNKAAKPTTVVKKVLINEQFTRLLLTNDKKLLQSASKDYDLTNQQELELTVKLELL